MASTWEERVRALEAALKPKAAHRAYLAIVNKEGKFGMFHGLRRWVTSACGVNKGNIVLFEEEVHSEHCAPHL